VIIVKDEMDNPRALVDDAEEITRTVHDALRGVLKDLAAYHMDACVRCGLCGESCHVYKSEPTPENLPAAKAAKVVRHFRRYYTTVGRVAPFLLGAKKLTPAALDEVAEAVYGRCTGCGRCGLNCSVGADVGTIIWTGRNIVATVAKVPPELQAAVDNQLNTGNQMAISIEELKETAAWLSEDLQLEMGDEEVRIHVDEPGKRVFYLVNPREVKFFPLSLSAAAGLFHAAGESWTTSSKFYDVTNYGFYSGDDDAAARITKQVMDEAVRLGAEEVIVSECGHGFRAFRWEGPNWLGEKYPIKIRSILEIVLEYIEEGRIKVDPSKNAERVTLHDPCNLVRWSGVSEPQRKILTAVATDFVEMTPNREQNFCCGGGGGMLSLSEYGDRRVRSGAVKAEQIKAAGAKVVAAPCHNCADQLLEINKRYSLGVEVLSVCELVYNALVLD
jgi:Fe-S oxidoreductase